MAQEVITPLYNNPLAEGLPHSRSSLKKSAHVDLLELPIFDDFSNTFIHPDTSIWSDTYAFVNNNFCLEPVSNGVATLDALDEEGSIYAHAVFSPSTFEADLLTSKAIRLDYPASDSIYLSFLYQAGGLCDLPEEGDSLMVDFFAPDSASWINVWSAPGSELRTFRHAMIPVKDSRFLVEGFRFRFRNKASLPRTNDYPDMRNNVDYWHVDYIRLHGNRFAADTLMRDVAFNSSLSTMLKDLTSLPWSHFEAAYNTVLYPFVSGQYRNNDTITRNVTRSLTIFEPAYGVSHTPGVSTAQDLPGLEDTVVNFGFIYPFDFDRGDSALLRFKAALRTDEFDPKVNDTVVHEQLFKDFYAYDDGTAEAGYGLRGKGSANGVVAVKYNSFTPDLLGGVYVSFNQVYDSLNLNYYFNLVVWDDQDGLPGSIVWEDEKEYKVAYPSTYPGFVKYEFSEPVPVDGTFYVGWRQYNEYMLSVGLDKNSRPSVPAMYYNIGGSWQVSEAPGVMMFRPYIYDETAGIENATRVYTPMQIYPNPATDRIYFQLPPGSEGRGLRIEILDASGRMIRQLISHSHSMDISELGQGLYYIRAVSGSIIYHSKLVVNP
ncbi:MAG: T9SS type A sorting domain-containing protein [Bacteroidota bacterium]